MTSAAANSAGAYLAGINQVLLVLNIVEPLARIKKLYLNTVMDFLMRLAVPDTTHYKAKPA